MSLNERLANGEVVRYPFGGADFIEVHNTHDRLALVIESVPGNPDVTIRIADAVGETQGEIQIARVQLHNLIGQVALSDMTSVNTAGRP